MSDAIWAALIAGAVAIIGDIIISARNTKDLFSKLDKRSELADQELKNEMSVFKAEVKGEIALLKNEVGELRKTVEKHNGIVERTYHLETELAKHGEQIKALANK